jgi:hypothetical protein
MRVPDPLLLLVRRAATAWVLLLAVLLGSSASLAHGGQPAALSLSAEAAGPGALLEVTGADFTPDDRVQLAVSSGLGGRDLSEVRTDAEGHFFDAIILPADLAGGIWEVRARDSAGVTAVRAFVVEGATGPARPTVVASGGADILALGAIGVALLVIAGSLLIVGRLVRKAIPSPS